MSPVENNKTSSIENLNNECIKAININKKGLIELITIYNSIIKKIDSLIYSFNNTSYYNKYSCLLI